MCPRRLLAAGGAAVVIVFVGVDRAGAVGLHDAAGGEEISELLAAALDA